MTFFKLICVALYVLISTQIRCWAAYLNMMTDAFDDQYINCSPTLEDDIMPEILKKEQLNEQFSSVWDKAEQEWNEIKQDNIYPAGLKDEYGIAVIAYTSEIPYPIYKQFNGNMSIAGRSRDHYMQNFHFKALHFYLTTALRVLGAKDCRDPKLTFRGTTRLFDEISPVLRFGQFASTSLNITIAEGFGIDTFFEITTCFGVYIHDLSYYEEQELLIPVSEIFENVGQYENTYFLNSTGQQCSYFNCAYLGGEKLEVPMCRSGEKQDDPNYNRAFPGRILISEDIYLLMFFNFAAVKLMSTL